MLTPWFQSTDPMHIPAQDPPSFKHPLYAHRDISLKPCVLVKSDLWLHQTLHTHTLFIGKIRFAALLIDSRSPDSITTVTLVNWPTKHTNSRLYWNSSSFKSPFLHWNSNQTQCFIITLQACLDITTQQICQPQALPTTPLHQIFSLTNATKEPHIDKFIFSRCLTGRLLLFSFNLPSEISTWSNFTNPLQASLVMTTVTLVNQLARPTNSRPYQLYPHSK